MLKLKDNQVRFHDDFYTSYKRVLERKNTFLILEKIYLYTKKMESFINEMAKLGSLLKTKNFGMLASEIEKLNAFTDNHVFFLLLENVVRNEIHRFVEEVNATILASLNLELPFEKLTQSIDTLLKINKTFNRNEKKTLLAINQVLLSNAKSLLLENLKHTKDKIQYSKPALKYVGYLNYFSEEIEKNIFDSDKNKYSYYNNFYQQVFKLSKIYHQNNMFLTIGDDISEKMEDLFNYFLRSLNNEIDNISASKDYHTLLILINKVSVIHKQGKTLFDEFQCEDLFIKFDKSIKTIIDLAISLDTNINLDYNTLDDPLEVVSLIFDRIENFSKNVLKKLKLVDSQYLKKFVHEIIQNMCKHLALTFGELSDDVRLKVK